MRDMDTTKIIALGLVAMGAVSTLGYYICMGMGMAPTIEPTISIITGLFGAIGVVTGKALAQKKDAPKSGAADAAGKENDSEK